MKGYLFIRAVVGPNNKPPVAVITFDDATVDTWWCWAGISVGALWPDHVPDSFLPILHDYLFRFTIRYKRFLEKPTVLSDFYRNEKQLTPKSLLITGLFPLAHNDDISQKAHDIFVAHVSKT